MIDNTSIPQNSERVQHPHPDVLKESVHENKPVSDAPKAAEALNNEDWDELFQTDFEAQKAEKPQEAEGHFAIIAVSSAVVLCIFVGLFVNRIKLRRYFNKNVAYRRID